MIQAVHKQTGWLAGGREGGSAALDQDNTHATQHTQMYMRYKRSGKKPNELSVSDDFSFFPHQGSHEPAGVGADAPSRRGYTQGTKNKSVYIFLSYKHNPQPKARRKNRKQPLGLMRQQAGICKRAGEPVKRCPLVTGGHWYISRVTDNTLSQAFSSALGSTHSNRGSVSAGWSIFIRFSWTFTL